MRQIIRLLESMTTVKPITPEDCIDEIPSDVITAFNTLIKKNYRKGRSTFTRYEIVNEIINIMGNKLGTNYDIQRKTIFDRGYLDVEEMFQKYMWNVFYYQEDVSRPYFVFDRKYV